MIPLLRELSIVMLLIEFTFSLLHIVIAFIFIAWTILYLGDAYKLDVGWSHEIPERLTTTGAFGKVRHPQYLGADIVYVAGALIFNAFYALIFTQRIFCSTT